MSESAVFFGKSTKELMGLKETVMFELRGLEPLDSFFIGEYLNSEY